MEAFMDLKIKDVATLLNVSEETIHQWIKDRKIPFYRLKNEIQFNREEIDNWVIHSQNDHVEEFSFDPQYSGGLQQFSLFRAIHRGGVIFDIEGSTKEDVIRNSMTQIADSLDLDADVISEMLLDRERLMPTALNDGVAVPHTRDFLLSRAYDVVTVAFPKEPVAYGALDGKPVHTLFFLFASKDTHHLNLLAKIAHFCNQKPVQEFLKTQPSKEAFLKYVKEWEAGLSQLQTVS